MAKSPNNLFNDKTSLEAFWVFFLDHTQISNWPVTLYQFNVWGWSRPEHQNGEER